MSLVFRTENREFVVSDRMRKLCCTFRYLVEDGTSDTQQLPIDLEYRYVSAIALEQLVKFCDVYCKMYPYETPYETKNDAECRSQQTPLFFDSIWDTDEINDDLLIEMLRAGDFLDCKPFVDTLVRECVLRFATFSLDQIYNIFNDDE